MIWWIPSYGLSMENVGELKLTLAKPGAVPVSRRAPLESTMLNLQVVYRTVARVSKVKKKKAMQGHGKAWAVSQHSLTPICKAACM